MLTEQDSPRVSLNEWEKNVLPTAKSTREVSRYLLDLKSLIGDGERAVGGQQVDL